MAWGPISMFGRALSSTLNPSPTAQRVNTQKKQTTTVKFSRVLSDAVSGAQSVPSSALLFWGRRSRVFGLVRGGREAGEGRRPGREGG